MALWDPFKDFDNFFYQPRRVSSQARHDNSRWAPLVDVKETDSTFVIQAELPGIKKEDVKIEANDGRLTISGERKREQEEKGDNWHRVERSFGSFTRSFAIPDDVHPEDITANYTDGVLTVNLPKPQKKDTPKSHVITIQ